MLAIIRFAIFDFNILGPFFFLKYYIFYLLLSIRAAHYFMIIYIKSIRGAHYLYLSTAIMVFLYNIFKKFGKIYHLKE